MNCETSGVGDVAQSKGSSINRLPLSQTDLLTDRLLSGWSKRIQAALSGQAHGLVSLYERLHCAPIIHAHLDETIRETYQCVHFRPTPYSAPVNR